MLVCWRTRAGMAERSSFQNRDELMLIRMVNNDPKITAAMMKANLTATGVHASRSMIT